MASLGLGATAAGTVPAVTASARGDSLVASRPFPHPSLTPRPLPDGTYPATSGSSRRSCCFAPGFWTGGAILQAVLAYALLNTHGWRILVAVTAIPFAVLVLLLVFVPESPRWLLVKGRVSDAERVLALILRVRGGAGSGSEGRGAAHHHCHMPTATCPLPAVEGVLQVNPLGLMWPPATLLPAAWDQTQVSRCQMPPGRLHRPPMHDKPAPLADERTTSKAGEFRRRMCA